MGWGPPTGVPPSRVGGPSPGVRPLPRGAPQGGWGPSPGGAPQGGGALPRGVAPLPRGRETPSTKSYLRAIVKEKHENHTIILKL